MKTVQLIYPSNTMVNLSHVAYVQIGIQRPHNIPITEIIEWGKAQVPEVYKEISTCIRINGELYTITDRDILEFGDVYFRTLNVELLETNPYLIVDLAYETTAD